MRRQQRPTDAALAEPSAVGGAVVVVRPKQQPREKECTRARQMQTPVWCGGSSVFARSLCRSIGPAVSLVDSPLVALSEGSDLSAQRRTRRLVAAAATTGLLVPKSRRAKQGEKGEGEEESWKLVVVAVKRMTSGLFFPDASRPLCVWCRRWGPCWAYLLTSWLQGL
jgi:hypothetical protein